MDRQFLSNPSLDSNTQRSGGRKGIFYPNKSTGGYRTVEDMELAHEPEINPNVKCQNCEDNGVFLDLDDQEWSCWCQEEPV